MGKGDRKRKIRPCMQRETWGNTIYIKTRGGAELGALLDRHLLSCS
jgi:hypothetical protein